MTDAPKIDTQAPERIWQYTTYPAGRNYIREDIAAAREAAAAQAMREAAAVVADDEDGDITTYGEHKNTVRAQAVAAEIAMHIRALPLPDPAALDRLIAERVRVAVEAEREACAKIADERASVYRRSLDRSLLQDDTRHADLMRMGAETAEIIAARLRDRGNQGGQS